MGMMCPQKRSRTTTWPGSHHLFAVCVQSSPYLQAEETSGTPLDMSFIDTVPHTYRLLASGGVAGCVSKTATAPLSRITILFQVRI